MTGRGEKGVAFLRLTSLPPPNLILERIFRLCVERCCLLATSSRRFDPTFPLAAPISLDGSAREEEEEGGMGILARPQPLLYTPSKIFGGGLDLSSSERRLRNDFIGSLTGSPIAIPVAYRNEDL